MQDSRGRDTNAWSDLAKPTPRFNYEAHGTDAYEEGLEALQVQRVMRKIREEEPDVFFAQRPSRTFDW